MKQRRQKQQPFYVKRIRLRKSILKTNQILQTISIYQRDPRKYSTLNQEIKQEQADLQQRKITVDHVSVSDYDLRSSKDQPINMRQMKNLIKLCQYKKERENQEKMTVIGLEVRRIVANPTQKKSQTSKDQFDRRHKSAKNTKMKNASLFSVSKQLSVDHTDSKTNYQNGINDYFSPFVSEKLDGQSPIHGELQEGTDKCFTSCSPSRKFKTYLYQRMAQSSQNQRDKSNQVYEKRIKSYTDFIWKIMLAHNVYLKIDLQTGFNPNKKIKAFVGYGNNCNMIKGLLKRRFWWNVAEQFSEDCLFVWTQIKVNKIFERQESAKHNFSKYKGNYENENRNQMAQTCQSTFKRKSVRQNKSHRKLDRQQWLQEYSHHLKIWNLQDLQELQSFFQKQKILSIQKQSLKITKQISYQSRTTQIKAKFKQIQFIDSLAKLDLNSEETSHNFYKAKPLVHNHLQNNFFLGNKKALFYNLKDYYNRIGEDVFEYVPLTFHIKQGFKDSEYKRFLMYYQKRANLIKKQEGEEEDIKKSKTRNIWIVKPGQNSNQGQGITVIDQIYQLNNIIKTNQQKQKSNSKQQPSAVLKPRTLIVQMYIDRPFLYNDRKFDIRHYMLMTNIYGVTRAYWFQQGYIRTSSYLFNIHCFDPQIHLTNDAIQKHYPEYSKYQPYNKVSYAEFQNYLNNCSTKKYNFKEQILPKMKKMAQDAARSVYTKISPKQELNNFQIFGLDFMIDKNFKPWLIQINTNPCLDCACPLLDRIIPYMVEQSLKLSLDIVYPPPSHYPNSSRHFAPLINLQTFKYQLIFDSLSDGQQLQQLYRKPSKNLMADIGVIEEDEQFMDNGKQIKLQDFT